MTVIQLGLVDKTGKLDAGLVQAAAAAINVQVIRDLPQYWPVTATVQYLPDPKRLPPGIWPIFLVDKLPPGEGGAHLDRKNQPYAQVAATPGSTDWTLDASHEALEMLVDPAGNRLQSSMAIAIDGENVVDANGQFQYLVEACDPCEDSKYAYSIQGIAVSDFITPHYYDPAAVAGTRYSFGGNIQRPRQLLPGGYISFVNPQADEVQQILFLGAKPELRNLGTAGGASLREFVDNRTHERSAARRRTDAKFNAWLADHRSRLDSDARRHMDSYAFLFNK